MKGNKGGKGGFGDNPQNINRKGRPTGSGLNLTSLLKERLEKIPDGKKKAYKEIFIDKLLHKALVEGDIQSFKLIMNYVDGLPKSIVDMNLFDGRETQETVSKLIDKWNEK